MIDFDENLKRIRECQAFVQLYSETIEELPCLQLGIAITLQMPIAFAVLPGRTLPDRLALVADRVFYGQPHELAPQIAEWMVSLEKA